ncbi:MAG TPA: ABC transporter substrate-binding protein, partial [Nitrolancea sp.]|nr:ABC transporter substrate-binding protein [Nitrolancea sp.]
MGQENRLRELMDGAMSGRLSRRDVLRRAALLGLSAPVVGALLAACGGSSNNATSGAGAATSTTAPTSAAGAATATRPAAATSTTAAASPAASPVVVASPSATGSPAATAFDKNKAPAVPNPQAAKQYSGQKITYYGDSVGAGHDIDMVLTGQFTKDTGIEVNVVPHPQSSDDTYAQYLRFFQGKSSDMDVMMLDVIWPGALAPHLHDLTAKLGTEAKQHYSTIIANNTVNGK